MLKRLYIDNYKAFVMISSNRHFFPKIAVCVPVISGMIRVIGGSSGKTVGCTILLDRIAQAINLTNYHAVATS